MVRKSSKKASRAKRQQEQQQQSAGGDGSSSSEAQQTGGSRMGLIVLSIGVAIAAIFFRNNSQADQLHNKYRKQKNVKTEPKKSPKPSHTIATITNDCEILETQRHDKTSFTQGLEYDLQTSTFLEGTGLYGRSGVRTWSYGDAPVDDAAAEYQRYPTYTRRPIQVHSQHSIEREYFGEGICSYRNDTRHKEQAVGLEDRSGIDDTNNYLVQLTWKENLLIIYDYNSANRSLTYKFSKYFRTQHRNEGWGIAYNPNHHVFYVSDGSHYIYTWDANNFKLVAQMPITILLSDEQQRSLRRPLPGDDVNDRDGARTIPLLNELEYDEHTHTLLANVWYEDVIVRIDMNVGEVIELYDLQTLFYPRSRNEDCMNGIAWANEEHTELWVTGKFWPWMFRVQLEE